MPSVEPSSTKRARAPRDAFRRRAFARTGRLESELLRSRCEPVRSWCALFAVGVALQLVALTSTAVAQVVGRAPVIQEIQILGLERTNQGEIEAQLRIKVGDPFDEAILDEDVRRLFESGRFEWVDAPLVDEVDGGIRVTIRVVERARIRVVRFEGIRRSDRRKLVENRRTANGQLFERSNLEFDTLELERSYRERGYYFVEVRSVVTPVPDQPGLVDVLFDVDEGIQVSVAEFRFRGNESFEEDDLQKLLETKQRSSFFGFPNPGLFDADRFFRDVDRLATYYRGKGFFNVAVSPEDFAFNRERNRVHLGIRVREGERFRVRDVQFEIVGAGVFPEPILRDATTIRLDQFYDRETIASDVQSLSRLYQDRAYIDVRVTFEPVIDAEGPSLTLIYKIEEGEKSYIENIEIRGNTDTKDKVIRRQLLAFPGEEFEYSKIQNSLNRLNRLQYFQGSPVPRIEPGSTPNQKTLVFEVEEANTRNLNFGAGIASGRGLVGNVQLTTRNFDITDTPDGIWDLANAFKGGGQELVLRASPGAEFSQYLLAFTEPNVFDSDTSFNFRVFRTDFLRENYRDDRIGFRVGIGQQLTESLRTSLGYRWESVDISDIDADAPPDVFDVEGTNRLSSLIASVSYDRTIVRPVLGPVDGWFSRGSYTITGGPFGADFDFSSATVDVGVFRTVFSELDGESGRHIFSVRTRFDWAEENRNTDSVPIFERFRLGGPRSVRGFRFNGLGPQFNRDPLGGTLSHYASAEYTFPIWESTLRGGGFLDTGILVADPSDAEVDLYRVSAGALVQINLPLLGQVVPIRLSWAQALREEDEDRLQLFQFDIGVGF